MKNILRSLTLAVLIGGLAGTVLAKGPVVHGGNFGIGLVIGEPGDWGITGKIWMARSSALQLGLNVDDGTVLQGDYLWHYYDLVHPSRGEWPLYVGVGGAVALEGEGAFAVRGPLGMDYLFDSVPVDLFVEVVPLIWFFDGGNDFRVDAGIGARYFF